MDNKKITLKQTVTDKDGNQQIKTISTYTDEAILASETNINEKISNLETNVETNAQKISENTAEIENLKAQGPSVPSYPFVVTDVGTYYPKEGYLFDSVTVPDITLEKAFKSIGYAEIPEGFYASIEHSKELASKWDPSNTSVSIFSNDRKLVYAPYIDTSNVTSMNNMFNGCSDLTTIPLLDTSKVTKMSSMFQYCGNLSTIPLLDTSSVTNMKYMFYSCTALTTIPLLNTSKVTNMNSMFYACTVLNDIPQLDTSNVTDMFQIFSYCTHLTTIPALDTSNVINMHGMFYSCTALTTIPSLNTSKVTDMAYMFYSCRKLSSILMTGTKCSFSISNTALGHDALVTLLNNLGTANSGATLIMESSKLALLSDEEKKIATDKGWILA